MMGCATGSEIFMGAWAARWLTVSMCANPHASGPSNE